MHNEWLKENKRGHGYFSTEYISGVKETRYADRDAVEQEQKSESYEVKSLVV